MSPLTVPLAQNFRLFDMNHLQGHKLLKQDGTSVWASRHLQDVTVIVLFFTGSWENHSYFVDTLHNVYHELQTLNHPMEVVYVGADDEASGFWKEFKGHPGWVAVAPEDPLRYDLRWIYDVTSLPKVVVVKQKDGEVITRKGVAEIEAGGTKILVDWLKKCQDDK